MLADSLKLCVIFNRFPSQFILFDLMPYSALSQFASVPNRDLSGAVAVNNGHDFDLNASRGYANPFGAKQKSVLSASFDSKRGSE